MRLICAVFVFLLLSDCGGKKSGSSPAPGPGPGTRPPEPMIVEPDEVTVIDSRGGAKTELLQLRTSGKHQLGRYLSEYLLVVKSDRASCIRLKMLPAGVIDSSIPEDFFENFDEGASACQSAGGDEDIEDTEEAPAPALRQQRGSEVGRTRQHRVALPMREEHRRYLESITDTVAPLGITSSPVICSLNIFRMPTTRLQHEHGEGEGLEATVSKTGRLLVVSPGRKVRVWMDEEYGNPCSAVGQPPSDFQPIDFNTAREFGVVDRLYMAHLENIARELESAYKRLTSAFGDVSDIDGNSSIDVFLSPDINREHFHGGYDDPIDKLRATMVHRPNDLSPFNAHHNPTSNEGEILYLWTPDPAGIYTYGYFASSNSITSNYSKGYLATQLMGLIIMNHKLLDRPSPTIPGQEIPLQNEQKWLIDALSLLAASYVGGNDYPYHFLAQYMTSRPQEVNMFQEISSFEPNQLDDERLGMLTMFGWYMHTKICGKSVKICDKLQELIDSTLIGEGNVAATLDLDWDDLFLNFGISVATQLADKPADVRALWNKSGGKSVLAPLEMPIFDDNNLNSTEVYPASPPRTVEIDNLGNIITGDDRDRTHATPFPNLDNLIYQVVMPDNDMDLQVVPNSLTYILLTGLTEEESSMIADFGRGLQVVIIPLGDRDSKLRSMYQEKRSEFAYMDVRPVNLTDEVDENRTYYEQPPLPQDEMAEYTLTPGKEIWITGSIDNFSVNGAGNIGDADSYNIKVDPCYPASSCPDQPNKFGNFILVQTKIRDFPSQLTPFTLITTTDNRIFSGRSMWGLVKDIYPQFEVPEGVIAVLCQSEAEWPGGTRYDVCANGGLLPDEFMDRRDDWQTRTSLTGAATFDATHQPEGYNSPIDNFFFSALGFPRFNRGTLSGDRGDPGTDFRAFLENEVNRQFFSFAYSSDLEASTYRFYTVGRDTNFSSDLETLTDEGIKKWRHFLEGNTKAGCYHNIPPGDEEEEKRKAFIKCCTAIGLSEDDCNAGYGPQLVTQARELLEKRRFICDRDEHAGGCDAVLGELLKSWFPPGHIVNFKSTSHAWTSFYEPVYPEDKSGACAGEPADFPGYPCAVDDASMDTGDIRHQFNIDSDRFWEENCVRQRLSTCADKGLTNPSNGQLFLDDEKRNCVALVDGTTCAVLCIAAFGKDYDVCGDDMTWHESAGGGHLYVWADENLPSDRPRARFLPLATKRGEIIGKSDRIHYAQFAVPSEPTIFNVLIGGLNNSTGKYLIRLRMLETPVETEE